MNKSLWISRPHLHIEIEKTHMQGWAIFRWNTKYETKYVRVTHPGKEYRNDKVRHFDTRQEATDYCIRHEIFTKAELLKALIKGIT